MSSSYVDCMVYNAIRFKQRFGETLRTKMDEKDSQVRYIEAKCACGWSVREKSKNELVGGEVRNACVSHIDKHNSNKYKFTDNPEFEITLYTDEMLEDVDLTVN